MKNAYLDQTPQIIEMERLLERKKMNLKKIKLNFESENFCVRHALLISTHHYGGTQTGGTQTGSSPIDAVN